MFNRAEIIDSNFLAFVNDGKFPKAKTTTDHQNLKINQSDLLSIFETQVLSRHMDLKARLLKEEGKCFYTIGSSGHEGNAVFGKVFSKEDIAESSAEAKNTSAPSPILFGKFLVDVEITVEFARTLA